MKRNFTIIALIIMMSMVLQISLEGQQRYKKPNLRQKMLRKLNNTPFFSQGSIFYTSNKNQLYAHFILKNNGGNGPAINGAKVMVNNRQIGGTNIPGEYKGYAPVFQDRNGNYTLSVRIETPNRRVLTARGTIDALLRMEISNLFPRQPNKIDVGTPVRLNWYFTPARRNRPVNIKIIDTRNGERLFTRKNYYRNRVVLPVRVIPPRRTVRIKVAVPMIHLRYDQGTHRDSSLKVHVKDEVVLQTFG